MLIKKATALSVLPMFLNYVFIGPKMPSTDHSQVLGTIFAFASVENQHCRHRIG